MDQRGKTRTGKKKKVPVGTRFFGNIQTGPEAHPASFLYNCYRVFPMGWGMALTLTHVITSASHGWGMALTLTHVITSASHGWGMALTLTHVITSASPLCLLGT
jgi:hypothetical protein